MVYLLLESRFLLLDLFELDTNLHQLMKPILKLLVPFILRKYVVHSLVITQFCDLPLCKLNLVLHLLDLCVLLLDSLPRLVIHLHVHWVRRGGC